jgi:hypothetical protein
MSCGGRPGLSWPPSHASLPLLRPHRESWAGHLRACDVVFSPEWDRLSDHNPVVARFDFESDAKEVRSSSGRISGGNEEDEIVS